MKNLQIITDKAAISLSLLCAVHCLIFPLLITFLPSLAALPLGGEAFHYWMVIAVIPTSAYALTLGCKKHQRYWLLTFGVFGLLVLMASAFLGEAVLGELGEKALTVIGAGIIAFSHYRNYLLCRKQDHCVCPPEQAHP